MFRVYIIGFILFGYIVVEFEEVLVFMFIEVCYKIENVLVLKNLYVFGCLYLCFL